MGKDQDGSGGIRTTFIKFGEFLADRPDIVPEEMRVELRKLQDEAVPMPDSVAIAEIEKNLGHPVSELFRDFNNQRLASASVAQTYRATLLNGENVCVKVQRPGIDKKINLDLNLMRFFAVRSQKNNPEMEAINVVGVVEELGRPSTRNWIFTMKQPMSIRFSHCFEGDPDIYVPKVFQEFTTGKILVEEFIEGVKVSEMESLLASGSDPVELAKKAMRLVFEQIFRHGFFHADPHPGNIFIKDKHVISFIDYG